MKQLLLSAVVAVAAILPATAQDHHSDWVDDFDAAVTMAKAEGKDLLVDFTGSDWCSWCIKLHEEVFDHEAFLTSAKSQYILVALDFPRSEEAKAKGPNPERNRELATQYGVKGYPTILLMSAEGEVFARTGYQAGGPEAYIKSMGEMVAAGKAAIKAAAELTAAFQAAGDDKAAQAAVVMKAISAMGASAPDAPGMSTIIGLVRKGYELGDGDLQVKALTAIMSSGAGTDDDFGLAKKLDPKNENGLLDHVVVAAVSSVRSLDDVKAGLAAVEAHDAMGGFKDKDMAFTVYLNVSFWCHKHLSLPAKAKVFAQKAIDNGTDIAPRMQKTLDEILAAE